jgi:DNA-binding transcriptional LysR family regulator
MDADLGDPPSGIPDDEWPRQGISDWNCLRALYETVRLGSFHHAADILGVDQTTVSRRVRALEKQIGVPLVVRTAHGVRPTDVGRRVYSRSEEVEVLVRRLRIEAGANVGLLGKVRLATTDGVGAFFLPTVMERFHALYPSITLEIVCSNETPDVTLLQSDIAITYVEPRHSDIVILAKRDLFFVPFASHQYLERFGLPTSIDDLRAHRILDRTSFYRTTEWAVWQRIVDGNPNVIACTNSSIALGYMTKYGLGISLLPENTAMLEPGLVPIDIPGLRLLANHWLISRIDIKDIPRIRVVIDFLRDTFFKSVI